MSGSGGEALSDVRELSGCPPGCPGEIGRLSRMSGSSREALKNVQEWSGGPPGCLGGPLGCMAAYGRPSQMSASGWEPSRMSGSGREALLDVREW